MRLPKERTCPVCFSDRVRQFCEVEDLEFKDRCWEVWKCAQCQGGWTVPTPTPKELARYYAPAYLQNVEQTLREYRSEKLQGTRSWQRFLEMVALVEGFCPEGAILDVGCANGRFLLALGPQRWRRVGIDVVGEAVEVINRQVSDVQILQGDIHRSDLPPASFDVITFWHVLEHLFEPRKVLERTRTLLKPGGLVFVSVPNFETLQAGLFRRHWWPLDVPRHLYHFSPRSLERLLTETGLVPLKNLLARRHSFHPIKHNLLRWSESRFSSRLPYYALKPTLFGLRWIERLTGKWGSLTTVARKPQSDENAQTRSSRYEN